MCYTHFHDDFESLRTVNPPEHNLPAVLLHDITWLIFGQNTDFLAVQSISAKMLSAISTNSWVERSFQKPKCQSDLHPSHGINYSAILLPSQCMVKVAHQITHCNVVVSAAPDCTERFWCSALSQKNVFFCRQPNVIAACTIRCAPLTLKSGNYAYDRKRQTSGRQWWPWWFFHHKMD